MPRITYATEVGPGVVAETEESFAPQVDVRLADRRGWKKYGYDFVRVSEAPDLLIRLETSETAARKCGISGFSCWREPTQDIILHEGNWMGGSKSTLPLERYRNYQVMHEVGHALGLGHQKCPIAECKRRGLMTCPAPVMMQMTRGARHVWPCVETDWPLDPDWRVDDPGRVPWAGPSAALLYLASAIVIILVVCLVGILTGRLAWRNPFHNVAGLLDNSSVTDRAAGDVY